MFEIFKSRPKDAKSIRAAVLDFLKEQLQNGQSGESANLRSIVLYITCQNNEKQLYESALDVEDENSLKEDIQKVADDFAIPLRGDLKLEMVFVEKAPPEAVKANHVEVALYAGTKKYTGVNGKTNAVLKVLGGEAECSEYSISSTIGKVNIGRESRIVTTGGFQRVNHIAFMGNSQNESNRSVSRQHAHIEWDVEAGAFFIFADDGGIPPSNKTKVKPRDGQAIKLQTTQIGHRLRDHDQLIIGESAILEYLEK